MLPDVTSPTRTVIASIVLAGAMAVASAASAATVNCDCGETVVSTTPAPSSTPVARPATVHPMSAASNSTRHVAHEGAVHHRRHAHTHHAEPNLRAHVVTAASLPARVPARSRVPRSSHRAPALAFGHRSASTRAGGSAGLPISAASALSIAILGTCVHQRTRTRLRSVSQPLESRGPPRAGPHTTLAARFWRGARESTGVASAPHPPIGGPHISRVSPSPLGVPPHLAPPSPSRAPLERPDVLQPQQMARQPLTRVRRADPRSPFPAVQGPMAPRGVPVRGQALYDVDPSIRRKTQMKRIPAVLAAVVAMAFVATMAFAEDTTAPATTAPAKTAPAKTTSSTTHHHSSSSKSAHTPKTDLNTASKEDLMKLPGVDDATADKIIAARPFKSRSELESKNIVTKEQYGKLSAMVTVAPPQKSAAK